MKHILCSISLLVISIQASAIDFVKVTDFPQWFQKSMSAEKKVKKKSKLVIDSLGVKTKVKGKITLAESNDSYQYYTIDMKTTVPAECYVFSEFDGIATSLYSVVNAGIDATEKLNKKSLTGKFNYALDSGIIDSVPYLSLDVLYTLGEGQEKVSGLIKGYSAKIGDTLQICLHNELGYRKTFFTIFESFIQGLASSSRKEHFFQVVYQMTLNDIPAGIATESYSKDKEGDIKIVTESAMLMPVDASSIASVDTGALSFSDSNGDLINSYAYSIENAALAYSYNLDRKDEAWVAIGESQGKAQTYTLPYNGALVSGYGNYLKAGKFLASDEKISSMSQWMPEVDPSSVTTLGLKKLENTKDANIEFDMGIMSMRALVDNKGVASTVKIIQGPVVIQLNTIHKSGAPY